LQRDGAETYVVTGPLWMPSRQRANKLFELNYSAIGSPPSLVSVPTHFFKVVAVVKSGQIIKYACFVVGNEEPSSHRRSLEVYLVPWTNLEAVTGLHFFPALTSEADWKQRANMLVNEIVKDRIAGQANNTLLLTDGSAPAKNEWFGKRAYLEHLCADGKCR
jgi:DNA/RNA endonuclease G (NUC1)